MPAPILAVSAVSVGAVVGLVVGIVLSVIVFRTDLRKRQEGTRTRPEYRGSLFVVPLVLCGLGALAGTLVSNLT